MSSETLDGELEALRRAIIALAKRHERRALPPKPIWPILIAILLVLLIIGLGGWAFAAWTDAGRNALETCRVLVAEVWAMTRAWAGAWLARIGWA